MKILLLVIFIASQTVAVFSADYSRDFGFQFRLGGASGIGESLVANASLMTDIYAYHDQIRVLFGSDFLLGVDGKIPLTSVQQIGFNYLITPDWGLSARFFKSYIFEEGADFNGGKRGWIYGISYRLKTEELKDFLILVEVMDQPLKAESSLDEQVYRLQVAWEWF